MRGEYGGEVGYQLEELCEVEWISIADSNLSNNKYQQSIRISPQLDIHGE